MGDSIEYLIGVQASVKGKTVKITTAILALALAAVCSPIRAQVTHIPKAQLDTMFADMKANAPWDISGNLLWGYYFISSDKQALTAAGDVLVAQGYHLVEVREIQPGNGHDMVRWQLHVERTEHHTADSLFARNEELYAFVEAHPPVTYDGMDVGPAQ